MGFFPRSKLFVKKMYDFRSSLIHGEFNIPFKHSMGMVEEDAFFVSLNEANEIALAILFSTLQFMAENNIHELTFKVSYYLPNLTPPIVKKKKLSIPSS